MSERLALSPEEIVTQAQVNAVTAKDFYNGIRFAQGDDTLHSDLYRIITLKYASTWSDQAQAMLPEAYGNLCEVASRVNTPANHSKYKETAEGFLGFWRQGNRFLELCARSEGSIDLAEIYTDMRRQAFGVMMTIDQDRFTRGRPNRQPGHDPHSSQVREYVLGGMCTRSTFDAIFAEVRGDVESGMYADRLARLAVTWEEFHPGKTFYQEPA